MSKKIITLKYGIQMKEPSRIPPWLKVLLIILLIGTIIFGTYYFIVWIFAPSEEEEVIIEITPYVYISPVPTPIPTPTLRPTPTINPDSLYELKTAYSMNQYSVAWVNIPGVGLDSVVMQFSNNTFYLDHDINQYPNENGSIFLDYRNDINYIEEAGHIVIYGYGEEGGRQLRRLFRYLKEDYFNKNTLIIFNTMYGTYNFRVFSVHILSDNDYYTSPKNSKDKSKFIENCLEVSIYQHDSEPPNSSVILTFSTDIEHEEGDRFLVHAYLEE